jgi:hypothetical protein
MRALSDHWNFACKSCKKKNKNFGFDEAAT